MAIKIDKFQQNAGRYVSRAISDSKSEHVLSRELQMVPKYLECAKARSGDLYRFNAKEVKDITTACRNYKTNLSVTDIIKDLMAIGSEGNCKPLSPDDIAGFFKVTSGMKQAEQKNVLRFMKIAQEDIPAKMTPEYLKKEYPYENFRNLEISKEAGTRGKDEASMVIDETQIKNRYENFITRLYNFETNPYYSAQTMPKKYPIMSYIKGNNKDLIDTIANSPDPENLYYVLKHTGIARPTLLAAADLTALYKASDGNKSLVTNMAAFFYPDEIKIITEALMKDLEKNKGVLKNYSHMSYELHPSINTSRKTMLKSLGLEDKVKLYKIESRAYEDVYVNNHIGNLRGNRISGGNYERGKKK